MFKKLVLFYWPVFVFALFLSGVVASFYVGGGLILGGEGDYWLDFPVYLSKYGFAWQNTGTGFFSTSLSKIFPNILILAGLQKLISNLAFINFLVVFSIYFFPFFFMYILGRELKLSAKLSLFASLFYVFNPFSVYLFIGLNQWNLAVLSALPAFFLVILKFYHQDIKLFFSFGLCSLLFALANTNPPLMVILQISLVVFLLLASAYYENGFHFFRIARKYLILLFSFFVFNLWWILNWFYVLVEARKMYDEGTALSWLFGEHGTLLLSKIFLLKWLIPYDSGNSFLAGYFNLNLVQPVLLIPIIIVAVAYLYRRQQTKVYSLAFLILLLTGFLMKGSRPPLGGVYVFLVKYVPFFLIFKTSTEKWGTVFIFIFTFLIILSLKLFEKTKVSKVIVWLLGIYLITCSIPFLTRRFIPDYTIKELGWGSRIYREKSEYQWARQQLNEDKEDYRILSLPGSFNYQVALRMYADKYYTGLDPIISNINKPEITAYGDNILVNYDVVFDSIASSHFRQVLSLFGVRKIVLNSDLFPWFGFKQGESIDELESELGSDFVSTKKGAITIFENDLFLPHFYIPKHSVAAIGANHRDLIDVLSLSEREERLVVFFEDQIEDRPDLIDQVDEVVVFADGNHISGEELSRSSSDVGNVFFPYVKWSPDALIYPLILKKEQWQLSKLGEDKEVLIEKYLFFAAKRVSELEKFFSGKGVNKIDEQLGRYSFLIEKVIDLAATEQKREAIFKVRFQIEAHSIKIKDFNFSSEVQDRVENVFLDLYRQLDELEAKRDFLNLSYYIEVPDESEYELMIKADKGLINSINLGKGEIASSSSRINGWLSFGKHRFDQKENTFLLSLKESENLVDEQSWQAVMGAEIEDNGLYFYNQNLFPTELIEKSCTNDCEFYPNKNNMAIFQGINKYEPNTIYRINFDYFFKDGVLGYAIVENKNKDEITGRIFPILQRTLPITRDGSRHADFLFKSGKGAQSAEIIFFARASDQKITESKVNNIDIRKITEPTVLLRKLSPDFGLSNHLIPKIVFNKVNSTKYRVRISDASSPYLLVFNENFHREWKATCVRPTELEGDSVAQYFGGQIVQQSTDSNILDLGFLRDKKIKQVSNDEHIQANGYANVWRIDPQDMGGADCELIVEYWPQKLLYYGGAVSFVFFSGAMTYFAFLIIRRKNESH